MSDATGGGGPSEEALVARAQAGDRDAFRQLVERYQGRAYAVAYALTGRRDEALDVVQEAFLKAFRTLATFRGDSAFYTWFYRIVLNVAIDLARRERPASPEGLEPLAGPPGGDPAEQAYRAELRAAIVAALRTLPPEQRAVVVLREIEGLSYAEIAATLQVPIGTVMSRLFYARRKLRAALAPYRGA